MADARALCGALARRIAGISDPSMRVDYLAHQMRSLDPNRIADVVTLAMHGTEARDGQLGALMLGMCLALARDELGSVREAVVQEAIRQGQHDTAALLNPSPPARRTEEPIKVPDFGRGRKVSLGERKSLARRRDRDLIMRVLRDPSPDVIRILLGNPALTEDDVVRLCAQRPVAAAVLREVFRQPRWVVRYRIRRAIVRNPFSPLDIALQLASHLNSQDAKQVAASPELAVPLREACRRVAGLGTLH